MEEAQNPYSPPKSEIHQAPGKPGAGARRVFSPAQGGLGTFLGGPLAGAYFIRANFLALGNAPRARQTSLWGIVLGAVILLALPFLPEKTPGYIFPIVYSVVARVIMERMQFTKAQITADTTLAFHSGWRVVGVALLGLLIFATLGIAEFLLFPSLFGGGAQS